MLGSFPPARKRWCMDFFYPNFANDMWRIWGLLCFADKNHFVDADARRFRQEAIESFLHERGIALYDVACAVVRTRNTASDRDLDIVERTDVDALLAALPCCRAVVATGQKAADTLVAHFALDRAPAVGTSVPFTHQGRDLLLFRMPSSSRAYPLSLEAKAAAYRQLLPLLADEKAFTFSTVAP